MHLPLQPEPVAVQKPLARREELSDLRFIFGHEVIPDHKEDGKHRDHEKRKGSVKVQHTGRNH